MPQTQQSFKANIIKSAGLNYLLHLPKGYKKTGDPHPVILFLHGAGERGNNFQLLQKHGIPKVAPKRKDFPFITISPQCPQHSWWLFHFDDLITLLDEVLARYNADPSRVYLTGMSMGGNGTWGLAVRNPNRFAAIAPICGHHLFITGVMENPKPLKNMPIWAFHGGRDFIVPIMESAELINSLRKMGNEAKFTVYPMADHDSWTETYNNQELYDWFLQHQL